MQFIYLGLSSLRLILKFWLSKLTLSLKMQSNLVTITRTLTGSSAVVGCIPLVSTKIFIYINHTLGDVSLVVIHKLNTQNLSGKHLQYFHNYISTYIKSLKIFSDGTKENLIIPKRMLETLPLWTLTVNINAKLLIIN